MIRTRFATTATALAMAAALLAGCGSDAGRTPPSTQQGVSDVIKEQTQPVEQEAPQEGTFVGDRAPAFEQADYDLTAMGSDMVYATVNDMMVNPSRYEGKTVKMEGPYYQTFYEATDKNYFYVIIQDATACCAQGLEFVWDDGSHAYPDEYLNDGTEVVVCGTFESYAEESEDYVHLVNASLQATT